MLVHCTLIAPKERDSQLRGGSSLGEGSVDPEGLESAAHTGSAPRMLPGKEIDDHEVGPCKARKVLGTHLLRRDAPSYTHSSAT